ncbi:MAG: flavin reductase family protein [Caulobacteraceae bacterium]
MSIPEPDTAALRADFRNAMRRLASTVCVVTAAEDGRWAGMTMTAVASVSLEPPALLICANRASRLHALLKPGQGFCVNVLRIGHDAVAEAFGRSGQADEERFALGDWVSEGDGPYLADALASVFCAHAGAMDYGTHAIVVGEVRSVRLGHEGAPLIYGDGRYETA